MLCECWFSVFGGICGRAGALRCADAANGLWRGRRVAWSGHFLWRAFVFFLEDCFGSEVVFCSLRDDEFAPDPDADDDYFAAAFCAARRPRLGRCGPVREQGAERFVAFACGGRAGAAMPDSHEPAGHDVLQKSPQKFVSAELRAARFLVSRSRQVMVTLAASNAMMRALSSAVFCT